ncbi:MAG: hypothetical protein K2L70_06720 [Clostridia bacterium]|nr:hypothetical protein [Clostridia bacterium]
MKEFTKGNLTTVVEDNDRRISEYLANGWKEEKLTKKPKDALDKRKEEAIADADASEDTGKKNSATDQKVNDAMSAKENAAAESQAVDDGLIKSTDGGKNNG